MAPAGAAWAPEPIRIEPVELTADQLRRYLLDDAERVQLGLDRALLARDAAFDGLVKYAAAAARYAREHDISAAAPAYDVAGYARTQRDHLRRVDEATAELKRIELDKEKELVAARFVRDRRKEAGERQARLGAGAFGVSLWSGSGAGMRAGLGAAGEGARYWAEADKWYEDDRRHWEEVAAVHGEKPTEAGREASKAHAATRARRYAALDRAAGNDPPLADRVEEDRRLARAGDPGALADRLRRRVDADRQAGVTLPFRVAQLAAVEAQLADAPGAKEDENDRNARDLYRLGRRVAEAARWVPPDRLFDGDRVDLLTAAAQLVARAVGRDLDGPADPHRPQEWSQGFHPWADYGARLTDLALAFGQEHDPAGRARTVRATLLYQRGLADAATAQLDRIAGMPCPDPDLQFVRARVYAASERADDALAALREAFRLGFSDPKRVYRDPHLAQLVNGPTGRKLVAPHVHATLHVAGGGGRQVGTLAVRNDSAFPLTDLQLSLEVSFPQAGTRKPRTRTIPLRNRIPYLPAGSTEVLADVFVEPVAPTNGGKLNVTCKQGEQNLITPSLGKIDYRYSLWQW
ncbi:MAG: hypothetical protein K2X87_31830 [Gemmataceae bacterium]|nr:hypothetical protein [Gemmataceae bacterium]